MRRNDGLCCFEFVGGIATHIYFGGGQGSVPQNVSSAIEPRRHYLERTAALDVDHAYGEQRARETPSDHAERRHTRRPLDR